MFGGVPKVAHVALPVESVLEQYSHDSFPLKMAYTLVTASINIAPIVVMTIRLYMAFVFFIALFICFSLLLAFREGFRTVAFSCKQVKNEWQ
jgi:hypothetical protein